MSKWIKYKKSQKKNYENSFVQFDDDGLAVSGILVEVKTTEGDTKQFLIGEVNKYGGECNNCQDIDYDDEVIKYKKVYEEEENDEEWTICKKNYNFGNFVDSNLNIPGTLIEVFQFDTVFNYTTWENVKKKNKVTKQYLIGDVNETGGSDNHCMRIDNGDKVLKYKIVWKKD